MVPDPYAADTRSRNRVLLVVAICALVGLLLGGAGYALLMKRGERAPEILAGVGVAPPPVLESRAAPPPPVLAESRKTMPADVRAYLEHVELTEKKRADLSKRGLGVLLAVAGPASQGIGLEGLKDLIKGTEDPINAPDPRTGVDEVKTRSDAMRAEWERLGRAFDAVPPPPECAGLADSYRRTLKETGAQIADILTTVGGAAEDPAKAVASLEAMKGASKVIDEDGKRADQEVARICDKYQTRKWFGISSDFGLGGDLLGMPSVGAGLPR